MNLLLGFVILCSLAVIHGQGDRQTSSLRFPHGHRDKSGVREAKIEFIPLPGEEKQHNWRYPAEPYFFGYEDIQYPIADAVIPSGPPLDSSGAGIEVNNAEKRNGAGSGGMWFGPRLGKRRKRSIEMESFSDGTTEQVDTKTLVKILRNFDWAIVPLKSKNLSKRSPSDD